LLVVSFKFSRRYSRYVVDVIFGQDSSCKENADKNLGIIRKLAIYCGAHLSRVREVDLKS